MHELRPDRDWRLVIQGTIEALERSDVGRLEAYVEECLDYRSGLTRVTDTQRPGCRDDLLRAESDIRLLERVLRVTKANLDVLQRAVSKSQGQGEYANSSESLTFIPIRTMGVIHGHG